MVMCANRKRETMATGEVVSSSSYKTSTGETVTHVTKKRYYIHEPLPRSVMRRHVTSGRTRVRDDADANSGRDQSGYEEEVELLALAAMEALETMKGRKNEDPLPASVAKFIRAVRKTHELRTPSVTMVPGILGFSTEALYPT